MDTRPSHTSKIIVGLVLIIIVAVGIWYFKMNKNTDSAPTPVVSNYKDGTYTAVGEYTAPSGVETLSVSLTLKNNIITDATVTNTAKNDISKKLQDMFIAEYKTSVVGKDINTVKLNKISGSSLTPKGFNDALDKIKLQAQA